MKTKRELSQPNPTDLGAEREMGTEDMDVTASSDALSPIASRCSEGRKFQIFVDMDGVLADFDRHHEAVFGFRSCKLADNVDWKAVRASKDFYLNIPPMEDMWTLWSGIAPLKPIVLTGVPSSVEEAPENKRAWVRKHLGDRVEVRCCRSKEKYLHARPGDILIDDWEKYRERWIAVGGIWITHTSAEATLDELTSRMLELDQPRGLSAAEGASPEGVNNTIAESGDNKRG